MKFSFFLLGVYSSIVLAGDPCSSNAQCTLPEKCFDIDANGCPGDLGQCADPATTCSPYGDESQCLQSSGSGGPCDVGTCSWTGAACVPVAGIPEFPSHRLLYFILVGTGCLGFFIYQRRNLAKL